MDRWMDGPEVAEMREEDRRRLLLVFAAVVIGTVVGLVWVIAMSFVEQPAGRGEVAPWWEGGATPCDFFEDGSLVCGEIEVTGCLVGQPCDERSR